MTADEMIQAAKDGNLTALEAALTRNPALRDARAASGETPLMAALYRGHKECVAALVAHGVPLDIFAAAAVGNMDALNRALGTGATAVSRVAYDGWTALHLAAFFGHLDAAERLLEAGADLNAVSTNSLGNTPLHAAVAGGHVDVSLMLIARGGDVNAKDTGGHTPFHIAAEAGYVPVVRALLERGADAHIVDAEDRTPLARAAAKNHAEVVDLINLGGVSAPE